MAECEKERVIRTSGNGKEIFPGISKIHGLAFIFPLLLTAFIAGFVITPSHSSTIASEQRERISEIDRDLGEIRKGEHLKNKSFGNTILTGIRHYANKEYARVVFDLSTLPKYKVERGGEKGNVIRVIFERTNLSTSPLECDIDPKKGLLQCITAREIEKKTFASIFSNHSSEIKVFNLTSPPRIVIDVFRSSGKSKGTNSSTSPPVRGVPGKQDKIIVVIDPGHGGKDPGAIGPKGLKEKDVVLKISRMLKKHFDGDKRFKVHLTRNRDVFLSLGKRTAIANGVGAKYFISVHTNASRKRSARGISTFVLGKKATDKDALELAMRENGEILDNDSKANYIVKDLINHDKGNESLKLGKVVNDAIVEQVKVRRKHVLDLGVRKAPFYVLKGASMPAVLVEVSFITNHYEEKLLAKNWYLDAIANSVYKGITNYIDRSHTAFYGEASQ